MQGTDAQKPLSVSELTAIVKTVIDEAFGIVWVVGEVSNWRQQSSGHCYFTLKDAGAQLRCVMWRTSAARLSVMPQDGMEVLVRGNLTVYEAYGQYQLVASYVQPAGVGALQQAFEALKVRLADEGLFDPARKRPIPTWPSVVGVVTSGTGAAVRDIITVIGRRMPTTRIIVRPTLVQGAEAPADIVRAIAEMNAHGVADVLIVGRGGGSLEDLWAFNDESVVRAIVASRIPVISAVGHEIDFTLADFAADMRAPTPSAAAELVVPDRKDVERRIAELYRDMVALMREAIDAAAERLGEAWSPDVAGRLTDRVDRASQDIDRQTEMMGRRFERIVAGRVAHLGQLAGRLDALSPLKVLSRGYAVCERERDGHVITDAAEVAPRDRLITRLRHGVIFSVVEGRLG